MRIIAALSDPSLVPLAEEQGADMLEFRIDLMEGDIVRELQSVRNITKLPVIVTLRSAAEGGRFFGDSGEWISRIRPFLLHVDYIDIEQRFRTHADEIRKSGKAIIASYHTGEMHTLSDLFRFERDLRSFGDIVKIIVTPRTKEDIIELISFTHAVKQPICTGVMGQEFRFARAILPLFGSELVYCNVGETTAAGQFSVSEFVSLMRIFKG
jgi:3-dehydroquinate dehydratase-1